MRSSVRQLALLILGASLGSVGWGAVLPYVYADVAEARHLGATAAAVTFTALAVGALVAAPVAGRLADRARPVLVASGARAAMVLALVGFTVQGGAPLMWAAALVYGAGYAVVQPVISVLLLELTPTHRRRDAFAAQFIGLNLGLALGGLVGGWLVDLTTPSGVRPAYLFAAAATVASAVIVGVVGRSVSRPAVGVAEPQEEVGYRQVLRAPGVRWMLAVTVLLTLACYAQYDSGLPSYALTVLRVPPSTLGTAVAVNSVLVALLTAPVVRGTKSVSPATLLALCGAVWIAVWAVLAVPLALPSRSAAVVVLGYALFSVGETMLAPVLSPLAATLAPAGGVGRTMAAMNGAQTAATAVGPAISGALLGVGLPAGFIAGQIVCCAVAIGGARRLGRVLGDRRARRAPAALAA